MSGTKFTSHRCTRVLTSFKITSVTRFRGPRMTGPPSGGRSTLVGVPRNTRSLQLKNLLQFCTRPPPQTVTLIVHRTINRTGPPRKVDHVLSLFICQVAPGPLCVLGLLGTRVYVPLH